MNIRPGLLYAQYDASFTLESNELGQNTVPELESFSEDNNTDVPRYLDLIDVSDNESRTSDVTSLDSNSSEWADEEDMSRVSYADVIDSKTCEAVGNPRPDINDTCLLSSRPNSVLSWRELKRHVELCPPSALRHATLYPTVLYPNSPETLSKQCRHCGKRFILSISLEIHIMARHGSRDQLCKIRTVELLEVKCSLMYGN
jgi:hypothetical protein